MTARMNSIQKKEEKKKSQVTYYLNLGQEKKDIMEQLLWSNDIMEQSLWSNVIQNGNPARSEIC